MREREQQEGFLALIIHVSGRGRPKVSGSVLPVVLHGVGEDVHVVFQLVLDVPFQQDLLIVSTAIVFTEELLGLQSHEVGGGPLHPAHEHGDPQEEDHLDLPGFKLSNSFENIFVEKLHISR